MERDQLWITWELNKIKLNPMSNDSNFCPIGRRNFHLERDDNILLLSNKQPNEKVKILIPLIIFTSTGHMISVYYSLCSYPS